ncbi:TolA-binding protein [Anaerospora hongkongensis]|uniref:TolA-binding protein n=1 Tax=Anaerospora hongkongensis TaxID=244830 RepID=A0A4R1PZ39_9FIRM|nr:hypothetical protein [Anaerospora hongkongensis]TCL35923.1 TolA-binding protein [Anaerospora hongkongensis]
MEYTLITTFAIVITTLFVHQLANRILGIRLGIKPLALCGICSLFLSLVLPRIIVGFAGLAGTIGVLAVFAIIFAYFVAYYEDAQTDEPAPQAAPSFSTLVEDIGFTPGKPDAIPLPFATQLVTEEPVAIEEPVAEEPVAIEELVAEEPVAVEALVAEEPVAAQEPVAEESVAVEELVAEEPVAIEELVAEEPVAAQELVAEEPVAVEETVTEEPVAIEELITEEPVTVEELVAEEPVAVEELVAEEPVAAQEPVAEESVAAQELDIYRENYHNVTEVAGTMTQRMSNPFEPVLPVAQDLDSLLDYAFLHKENKAYEEALAAFRYILQLFPEDAAAPFVLIEIGNILKQLGAYDDAIQVFVDGRANVAVHADYQFEQEFINTIAYLRIIKNALIHHRLGLIPYHKIPANILDEINAEFREWRNLI